MPVASMWPARRAQMFLLVLLIAVKAAAAAPAAEWRQRTVFQVLTDRFATDQCWGPHGDPDSYNGGTFSGLRKKMSYIEVLGFDAVWISPITEQGDDHLGMSGYAGYWPANFYKVNPAFGTEAELVQLVQLYQQRGMLVLFDLVINHVGYGNWQTFHPFNKTSDFHDCNGCFTLNCAQDPAGLFAAPPISGHSYEHCQLSGLPDLNHSDPSVLQRMREWEVWLVKTFKPDGLRYDAATNSLPSFVQELAEAVPQWTISEIYLEEPLDKSSAYIADWVHDGRSDSAFAFTMQKALRLAIRERQQNMRWLLLERERWLQLTGDKVHDFGMFIENHDMPRWLSEGFDDYSRYMNGMAYILFTEGIPFIYYGAEQGFLEEREPLWYSLFQHSNPLWLFLRISLAYRKQARIWDAGVAETIHVDNSTLVLARGDFVILLTNVGQDGPTRRGFLTLRDLPGRFNGLTLRNIYNRTDKLVVSSKGIGLLLPDAAGKPQVFYKGTVNDPASYYVQTRLIRREMTLTLILILAVLVPALLLTLLLIHCWALQRRPAAGAGENAATKGSECDASYTPHDANGFLYHSGGKPDGGKASGGGRLGHLLLLGNCLRPPAGRSKPPVASPSVLENSDLMPRTRSMTHSRLREMSAAQVLTAGAASTLHACCDSSVHSAPAAASSGGGGERFDAFTGFSGVFKEPGRVSAVDLSQGLVLEEYYVLQEEYGEGDGDGLQQDVSISSGGELRRRKGDGQSRMENKLSTVPSGQVPDLTHVKTHPRSHSGSSAGIATPGMRPRSIIMANHSATRVALPVSPRPPLATPKGPTSTVMPFAAGQPLNGVAAANFIKADGSHSTTATATSPRKVPSSRAPSQVSSKSGGIHWPWKDRYTKSHTTVSDDPSVRLFDASTVPIMHVALEYSIPHLGFTNQLMFGGLGMVVTSFITQWPGPMSVMAPLYKACYGVIPDKDAAAAAAAAEGGGGGADGLLRPTFIPSSQLPLLEMTVDVAGKQLPVEVFKVETSVNSHARTYYLVQSELFRHRLRGQIYTFEDEDEMLTWLAIFNQATAAVIVQEGITHMQLHDYHGGLSLMYIPERLRPAVLYVAHNAHYDATFPIPTPARRNKVYEHLGLNAEQASPYVEHNGSLDMLRAVVMYLRRQQQGWGVVAVSPRYAQQIKEKLSVFWQLQPLGRPRNIIGILNCLDMSDSLAASDMTLEQVLVVKAESKRKLQETYCLAVGEQYTVLVFIGRITHQKGCDIIAEAAPYIMAHHPLLQLIMVGPTGDAIGSAASAKLAQLSLQYPDRMYCPQDYYVAGDEKNMLLVATDFCLVPSRFEPCGLVDIEFGWNGGLIIGHDTGGLGKMPGVYFNAQASHLAHLARKLEASVDQAMTLSLQQRHAMIADALSKRFPADLMMEQYNDAWANINRQYVETLRARRRQLEFLHDHADFFANKWARVNKKAATPAPATVAGGGVSAAAAAAATGGATAGPLGGVAVVPGVRYTAAEMFHDLREPPKAPAQLPPWLQNFPAAQRVSNYLLVLLQYWGLGPGAMLLSYLLLQEALVTYWDLCGLQVKIIDALKIASALFGTSTTQDFVPRLLIFFLLSTVGAPFWFYLAARLRPVAYIRLATVVIFLSYLFVFLCMYFTELLGVAVLTAGVCNLVANPTLAMGFLGDDDVEVSEVGRRMLTVSETTKFVLLAIGMLLAGLATTPVPHLVVTGILTLLSGALMAWFCHPISLSKSYEHLALTFSGQWELLKHLSCFWLTLIAATCDTLGLMLTGFLVITTTSNLDLFATFMAISFGASAAAVLWNYKFLCSRTAELRLNASMLSLATMPLYEMLKATVLVVMWARGLFAPGVSVPGAYATMLGVCGMLDLVMGGRSSVLGLTGFVTLPSREVVAIWQFIAIMTGSAAALLIIGLARVATLAGAATSSWLLFGLIAGLEVLRLCCMGLMAGAYPRENLSAP